MNQSKIIHISLNFCCLKSNGQRLRYSFLNLSTGPNFWGSTGRKTFPFMCPYLCLMSCCPLWPALFPLCTFLFLNIVLRTWLFGLNVGSSMCSALEGHLSVWCSCWVHAIWLPCCVHSHRFFLFFILSFVFGSPALSRSSLSDLSANSLHAPSPPLCFQLFLGRVLSTESSQKPSLSLQMCSLDILLWIWCVECDTITSSPGSSVLHKLVWTSRRLLNPVSFDQNTLSNDCPKPIVHNLHSFQKIWNSSVSYRYRWRERWNMMAVKELL